MLARDDLKPGRNRALARKIRAAARERFVKARRAEQAFARQLNKIAEQVGVIVKGFAPQGFVHNAPELNAVLRRYSDLLKPWAVAVSERMINEVSKRDEKAWHEAGREIGRALGQEIRKAPTGAVMKQRMAEQVDLITSLPLEAAKRVHELTIRALSDSTRAKETAAEIMRTGHVTKSRAMLIARTETSRTVTAMTQARAEHIGSEGYIWRTAEDSDVRELHRKLNGKFIPWDDPPIAGENGERAHAGSIYNCRCYAEPVIPDDF